MKNVKYSSASYSDVLAQIDNVTTSLETAKNSAMRLAQYADTSGWHAKADRMSTYQTYDSNGNTVDAIDSAAKQSYDAQINTYNGCSNRVAEMASRISNYKSSFEGLKSSLESIEKAVREFEESNKVVNIDQIVDGLINSGQIDTSSFDVDKFSYEVVDGVTVMYYELDGEKVTISDMINAFYTYTGMSMSANIEGRYLAEKMGVAFDENYQMNILNGVNGVMDESFTSNLFGIADIDSINAAAGSLGVTLNDDNDFNSILNTYGSNMNLSGLNSVIGAGNVNSLVSYGSTVGAGMLAAYTLTENLDFKKPKPVNPSPAPGPGTTLPVEPTEPEIIQPPELVEPTQEVIPEEIESEVLEQDFDELAREEFEAQGAEAIYERRSKVIEEIEGYINSGDENALREKLKEYGYSGPEVDAIMENPEFIKSACIEGDQRAALTEIANRLADEAGVEGFDTKYDDGQHYQDLEDGTTASEYIANMSLDENVSETRSIYKDARAEYENALNEANVSINEANEAKVNMEQLKSEFGDDTTKWTQEQADKYNTAVNEYNEAVKVATEKSAAVEAPKEAYLEARDNYNAAKEEFIDRIKNPDMGEDVHELGPSEIIEDIRIDYDVPKEPGRDGAQIIGDKVEVGTTILPYEPEIIQVGEPLVGNPDITVPEASIMPIESQIINTGGTNPGVDAGSSTNTGSSNDILSSLNITSDGVSFK